MAWGNTPPNANNNRRGVDHLTVGVWGRSCGGGVPGSVGTREPGTDCGPLGGAQHNVGCVVGEMWWGINAVQRIWGDIVGCGATNQTTCGSTVGV